MTDPPPDSPDGSPSPLDQIVDDAAPRADAVEWAVAELQAARTFESVAATLLEQGWSQSDTDAIVEEARVRTRELRGVVTRDDVLRKVHRRYQQSMSGGWFVGFPTIASGMRLIHSLANLLFLRRTRRRGPNEPDV
jgi:hypothetical protein